MFITLFLIIFLVTPFVGLYSLIRKQQFNILLKNNWSRRKILVTFLAIFLGSFIGIGALAEPTSPPQPEKTAIEVQERTNHTDTAVATTSSESIEQAVGTVDSQTVMNSHTETAKNTLPSVSPTPLSASSPKTSAVLTSSPPPTLKPVPQAPLNSASTKTYSNSEGNTVQSPTFTQDNTIPAGATARCKDGSYSFSQNRRGTCSHHGGVAEWL